MARISIGLLLVISLSYHAGCAEGVDSASSAYVTSAKALDVYNQIRAQNPRVSPPTFVRHADGRLAFLRGVAIEDGKLSQRLAVMPDGRMVSLEDAYNAYRANHEAEWGRMTFDAAEHIVSMKPVETHYTVWFDRTSGDPDAFENAARRLDPNMQVSRAPDLFFIKTSPTEIISLSRMDGVLKVMNTEGGPELGPSGVTWDPGVVPHSGSIPSAALTSGSDATFSDNGAFARDVRIGVQELGRGCAIDDSHEAFDHLSGGRVHYQVPQTLACASDSDCDHACQVDTSSFDYVLRSATCMAGRCVDRHTTAVSSRIASSQSMPSVVGQPLGGFHAAMSELFFTAGGISNSAATLQRNYDWLYQNDALIVNESIGTATKSASVQGLTNWSVVSDWYARHRNMTIVRAAGNRAGQYTSSSVEVSCGAFNSICVGSSAWYTEPRNVSRQLWSAHSRYKNPYWTQGAEALELEKPDLLAEGEATQAAIPNTRYKWWSRFPTGSSAATGTSYAAPVVTGVVALLAEQCGAYASPAYYRSLLRTVATWTPSRAEEGYVSLGFPMTSCTRLPAGSKPPLYPAPHLGCDHYGGAGVLSTGDLGPEVCPGGGKVCVPTDVKPCVVEGGGALTSEDFQPQPAWVITSPVEWHANSTKAALRQVGKGYKPLWSGGPASAGSRLRSTFSYYSCPADIYQAAGSLGAANNFDLVLSGRRPGASGPEIIFASEALDDTNEGFDVTLRAQYETLELGIIADSQLNECPDGMGGRSASEPYHWFLRWSLR